MACVESLEILGREDQQEEKNALEESVPLIMTARPQISFTHVSLPQFSHRDSAAQMDRPLTGLQPLEGFAGSELRYCGYCIRRPEEMWPGISSASRVRSIVSVRISELLSSKCS